MLSRIANDLFWMGRYIERSDHLARYMRVNYFASLDAPDSISNHRPFVLESILYMTGNDFEGKLDEEKVLYYIGLDPQNPISILSTIAATRQNALATRHLLSSEIWEIGGQLEKDYLSI